MIILHVSRHCGYCVKAISYMRELGLTYKEVEVPYTENLPIMYVEGKTIVGFDALVEEYPL